MPLGNCFSSAQIGHAMCGMTRRRWSRCNRASSPSNQPFSPTKNVTWKRKTCQMMMKHYEICINHKGLCVNVSKTNLLDFLFFFNAFLIFVVPNHHLHVIYPKFTGFFKQKKTCQVKEIQTCLLEAGEVLYLFHGSKKW